MEKLIQYMPDYLGPIVLVLALFVDITPAKICPWKPIRWVLRQIGKAMTSDVSGQIDKVDKKVDALETARRTDTMDTIRWEILDFANSCRNKRHHTKDEFEHVIKQNAKYEKLLKDSGEPNGVYTEEYKYILELYHQCQRENDFL